MIQVAIVSVNLHFLLRNRCYRTSSVLLSTGEKIGAEIGNRKHVFISGQFRVLQRFGSLRVFTHVVFSSGVMT